MALNLRVNFKAMQRKRLSESPLVVFPPTKRSYLEVSPKISDLDTSMAQVPLFDVARTGQELVVSSSIEKDVGPK